MIIYKCAQAFKSHRSPMTYWLKISSIFWICAGLNSENSKYTCRLVVLDAYSLAVSKPPSPFESDESSCMVGTYIEDRTDGFGPEGSVASRRCESTTESGIWVIGKKQTYERKRILNLLRPEVKTPYVRELFSIVHFLYLQDNWRILWILYCFVRNLII